jgi:hypothetical protein
MRGLQQRFLEQLNWDVVVLHLLLGMPTDCDIPELDDVSVEVVHALGRSDEFPIKAAIVGPWSNVRHKLVGYRVNCETLAALIVMFRAGRSRPCPA